jgi:hypothetical protein
VGHIERGGDAFDHPGAGQVQQRLVSAAHATGCAAGQDDSDSLVH